MAAFNTGAALSGRLRLGYLLLFWLFARSAAAQTSLGGLSSCGLSCVFEAIPLSGCDFTDIACQCASTTLQQDTTNCLLANCTMQDSLDVSRFVAASCGLSKESRSTDVMIIMSALYGGAALFVLLRVLSKLITRTFSVEDYVIIAAIVLTLAPFFCIMYVADLGFGNHIWDLKDGALLQILRLFYVAEIVYIVVLALVKASIACMYIRIFWAYQQFQVACYALIAFIALSSTVITLLTILSCDPISYFWDRDIKRGSCLDITALAYVNSGFAVAQDLLLIVLPIFVLWRLNMSRKKKFFIVIMFSVGSMGFIATVARLHSLETFGNLDDPTWSYVPVVYWTTVELAAGIISSCLPAIRLLLERFFKVLSLSADRSEPSSAVRLHRQRRALRLRSTPKDFFMMNDDSAISQRALRKSWGSGSGMSITSLGLDDEPSDFRRDLDWG